MILIINKLIVSLAIVSFIGNDYLRPAFRSLQGGLLQEYRHLCGIRFIGRRDHTRDRQFIDSVYEQVQFIAKPVIKIAPFPFLVLAPSPSLASLSPLE